VVRERETEVEPVDVEGWARRYILSSELGVKIEPGEPPGNWASSPTVERLERPGRPVELGAPARRKRKSSVHSLRDAEARARLLHSFWHHELQAAELMCWALLAFADAEPEFRRGLLGVCRDEMRHMRLYQRHIEALGYRLGAFGIRDWFWQRVPSCPSKLSFVALMGMGFEAANLEYAPNFANMFEEVGDDVGAEVQRRIAAEELSHVAFATHWFRRWTGGCDFRTWCELLPPPLSPWVLRGQQLDLAARTKAGMSEEFLTALAAFEPELKGRPVAGSHTA